MTTPLPPVSPEDREIPSLYPLVFQKDGTLFAATSAALTDDLCICCGRPSKKDINKALRNPWNPLTWFGGQLREEVGLCKQHLEGYYVALALTYSLLVLGILMIGAGIFSTSLSPIGFGVLAVLVCGVFRAKVPIWSPNNKIEPIELRGVGKKYRSLFPEYEGELPNSE
jgi:hypothetical protein